MLRPASVALIAVLAFPPVASAQFLDEQPRLVAGPMVGVSFANLRGAGASNTKARTGFVGGAFVTYLFTPYFGIQPEVFYVGKGASFEYDSAGTTAGTSTSTTYLEIPVLFKARYPVTGGEWPLTFSVVAGPAIGLLVSCKVDYPVGASVDCEDVPPNNYYGDRMPAGLDFSGIFGIGLDYNHFAFQARYDLSITDSYSDVSTLAPILKNVAWELTLGYKFGFH